MTFPVCILSLFLLPLADMEQQDDIKHYSFTNMGQLLLDTSLSHVAVDLSIIPAMNSKMQKARSIFSAINTLSKKRPSDNRLSEINLLSEVKNASLHNLFNEVSLFYTGQQMERAKRSFGAGLLLGLFGSMITGV